MSIHEPNAAMLRRSGDQRLRARRDPGRWIKTPVEGRPRPTIGAASCCSMTVRWHLLELGDADNSSIQRPAVWARGSRPRKRDPERDASKRAERREVSQPAAHRHLACRACRASTWWRRAFPGQTRLVDWTTQPPDAARWILGDRPGARVAEGDGPLLIVPGRIGKICLTTVASSSPRGRQEEHLGGQMGGAAHRKSPQGPRHGLQRASRPALSVRAACALLGARDGPELRQAPSNVAKVVEASAAIIAADQTQRWNSSKRAWHREYYPGRSARMRPCRRPPATSTTGT